MNAFMHAVQYHHKKSMWTCLNYYGYPLPQYISSPIDVLVISIRAQSVIDDHNLITPLHSPSQSCIHCHYECGKAANKSSLHMRAETDLSTHNIRNIQPHIKEHQIIIW